MERLNHRIRRNVIEIPSRRRNCPVSKLLGDDPDIDTFCPQLGGVRVPEAVGVHSFGDPGLATQSGKQDTDVAILEGLAVE